MKDCIAIDYDGTYTLDSTLWKSFVAAAHEKGFLVICATSRTVSNPVASDIDIPVVYCGKSWKHDATKAAGYNVLIWIDDSPGCIQPSRWIWLERIKSFFRSFWRPKK